MVETGLSNTTDGWHLWISAAGCTVDFSHKETYRGKLIIEFGQHGVVDEDRWVLLQSLQLLQKTLLVFLTAIPGGYRLEQRFPGGITPLQD